MDQFIQQLLLERGVGDAIAPEVREQLTQELTGRATDFINKRVIDAMSDESVDKFNLMLDDPNTTPEAAQQFIAANVPNQDKVVASALVEFRALYLGDKA